MFTLCFPQLDHWAIGWKSIMDPREEGGGMEGRKCSSYERTFSFSKDIK
jgi:hypothetical protein